MYFRLGQLMAMAVVHGGAAMHILSPSLFNCLSGMKPCDIIVHIDEVPDPSLREKLLKVCITVQFYNVVLGRVFYCTIASPLAQFAVKVRVDVSCTHLLLMDSVSWLLRKWYSGFVARTFPYTTCKHKVAGHSAYILP